MLNKMSFGSACSSIELRELLYEDPRRLLHILSSERVRYKDFLGDRFAETEIFIPWGKRKE